MVELFGSISVFDLNDNGEGPIQTVTNHGNTQSTIERGTSLLQTYKNAYKCQDIAIYQYDAGIIFRLIKDGEPINIFASAVKESP